MVEADPLLVEAVAPGRAAGEPVQAQRCGADHEHGVVERAGVLVEHRFRTGQPLVPGHADVEVGNGERDMGDGGKCGHRNSLSVPS